LKTTKSSGNRAAGIAALLSLAAAIFNYFTGSPQEALPVNFLLFFALTIIFAALWWSTRRR
jgi:hypothetical protein